MQSGQGRGPANRHCQPNSVGNSIRSLRPRRICAHPKAKKLYFSITCGPKGTYCGRAHKDNNAAERALRRPVIGRKLSFGSHSEDGAALQGVLLSVFATLDRAGINLWRWLEQFLGECALIGRQAVVADPRAWLPWGMSGERLASLQVPRARARDGPAP